MKIGIGAFLDVFVEVLSACAHKASRRHYVAAAVAGRMARMVTVALQATGSTASVADPLESRPKSRSARHLRMPVNQRRSAACPTAAVRRSYRLSPRASVASVVRASAASAWPLEGVELLTADGVAVPLPCWEEEQTAVVALLRVVVPPPLSSSNTTVSPRLISGAVPVFARAAWSRRQQSTLRHRRPADGRRVGSRLAPRAVFPSAPSRLVDGRHSTTKQHVRMLRGTLC